MDSLTALLVPGMGGALFYVLLWFPLLALPLAAPAAEAFETSAGNLLAVLRESPGANKQDDTLRPIGKVRAVLKGTS